MKPVIETHSLCKSYHGRPVVDHLNLTVPQGCVYGSFCERTAKNKRFEKFASQSVYFLSGYTTASRSSW